MSKQKLKEHAKLQTANFEFLKEVVRHQVAVRSGEKEGTIFDLETHLDHTVDIGLISLVHWSELSAMLEKGTG